MKQLNLKPIVLAAGLALALPAVWFVYALATGMTLTAARRTARRSRTTSIAQRSDSPASRAGTAWSTRAKSATTATP